MHAREGDEIDIESEPQLLQDVERTGGNAAMWRVRKGLREEQQSRSGGQGRSAAYMETRRGSGPPIFANARVNAKSV